ncbi:MAG: hypothetical protein VW127_06130 [Flavobacteriaceae bacterium]|jgi:hypothetical protein
MSKLVFIGLLLFIFGCENKIKPSDLALINGYWSIDYITHKDETFHPKGALKLLDFYEINGKEGIRKKVQPRWDNKFLITEDLNKFKIVFESNRYYLGFETAWDQWREEILKLNQDQLILKHQEKSYHYIRHYNEN